MAPGTFFMRRAGSAACIGWKSLQYAEELPMYDHPYARLGPRPPTPQEDICSCPQSYPLILRSTLSSNPVNCMVCNLEVPPEFFQPGEQLCYRLAEWNRLHDAVYRLWLDSGDYEAWARRELEDLSSHVNQLGLQLLPEMNRLRRTYYWYFQDNICEDYRPLTACPLCHQALQRFPLGTFDWPICEHCLLLAGNS